ncbi:hypothetical protein D3C73_993610 [compost metagenome]
MPITTGVKIRCSTFKNPSMASTAAITPDSKNPPVRLAATAAMSIPIAGAEAQIPSTSPHQIPAGPSINA